MADYSYYPESFADARNQHTDNIQQRNNNVDNGYDSSDEEYMLGNQEGDAGNEDDDDGEGGDEVEEQDYYAILNVNRDATDTQIRQSYLRLSLDFHPDKQPPHLRAQTTSKFNLIQKAYETLLDPQKRIIYDTIGEEGLRMRGLQVGTKAMSKEEFQYYIEEKIRRSKREALEKEVGSHSTLVVGVDGRSWFGFEQEFIEGPNGELIRVPLSDQASLLSRVFLQHGFHVPMVLLRRIVNEPVSVRRIYEEMKAFIPGTTVREKSDVELDEEQGREQALEHLPAPVLRLSASLGGQTMPTVTEDAEGRRKKLRTSAVVAQTGLEVSLIHGFPAVPPTQPLTAAGKEKGWMDKETSIARLLADSHISLSHQILARRSTVTYSRPVFGRTAGLQVTGQFYHAVKKTYSMPALEAMLTRQVTKKGTFFVAFSSGTKWGLNLPFGIGKWGIKGDWWGNSSSRIGFSYIGGSSISTANDEFDDGEEATEEEQGGEDANGSSDQTGNDNSKKKQKSKSRAASRQQSKRNVHATVYMAANRITSFATLVTLGFEVSRNFMTLPRPKSLPPSEPLPNSHRGIRAKLKSSVNLLGTLSLSVSFTRAIFTHSHLGLSLSIEPSDAGVVFGIIFRRLGQKIQIPIIMTKFMDPGDMIYRGFKIWGLGVMTIATGWWIWESSVVRPWERRIQRLMKVKARRALKESVEKGRREAEEAVELMREGVQRKIGRERECDGLVILEATYGLPEKTGMISEIASWKRNHEQSTSEKPRRIDVTIAVANLVDNSQLVIPARIAKSQLPGFYNPFPGQVKSLKITYLFKGIRHEVEVQDPNGVVCPHRGHVVVDLNQGDM